MKPEQTVALLTKLGVEARVSVGGDYVGFKTPHAPGDWDVAGTPHWSLAGLVIEKMAEKGWHGVLVANDKDGWNVFFRTRAEQFTEASGTGPTAPEAIMEAAAKALGVEAKP